MLDLFMTWHASMLHSIVERQQHPDMAIARKLSELDQKQWRAKRQQHKYEAKQRLGYGKFLAEQRDGSCKRKVEDMSVTEQQVLEEFDSKKLKVQHDQECIKKLPRLTGTMLYH